MNAHLKQIIARAGRWSEEDQEELAQVALEIEARRRGVYHATAEELRAIDEALAAVERGKSRPSTRSRRFSPNTAVHEGSLRETRAGGPRFRS